MSAWGNLDNVLIHGAVSYTSTSNTVSNASANATFFAANINAGDYIFIAGKKFQVENVVSNVSLVLTSNVGSTGSGNAFVQTGPKFVSNVIVDDIDPSVIELRVANLVTIQNVFGVDKNEANVTQNREKGLKGTGWTTYRTYTDGFGATRHKVEILAAMSKNFNSSNVGVLQSDASDDSTLSDYQLYFLVEPASAANVAGANVILTSNAGSNPEGAAITYHWWESADNTTYAKVNNGGAAGYSGNTSNILTIANVSNTNGYYFFVTATTTSGGNSAANSEIVTTTVS